MQVALSSSRTAIQPDFCGLLMTELMGFTVHVAKVFVISIPLMTGLTEISIIAEIFMQTLLAYTMK